VRVHTGRDAHVRFLQGLSGVVRGRKRAVGTDRERGWERVESSSGHERERERARARERERARARASERASEPRARASERERERYEQTSGGTQVRERVVISPYLSLSPSAALPLYPSPPSSTASCTLGTCPVPPLPLPTSYSSACNCWNTPTPPLFPLHPHHLSPHPHHLSPHPRISPSCVYTHFSHFHTCTHARAHTQTQTHTHTHHTPLYGPSCRSTCP